ncbi:major facilitator superfamily domain-containing protein [Flagelloscypha sp. PMI_526]|nr:major facilitator superfamily domain-containing protein [Flagelloscypha sp. PMI_526]
MSISSNTVMSTPITIANLEKNGAVAWDDDPQNPLNWSGKKKWTSACVVALYSVVAPMSSSIIAPVLGEISTMYRETNATVIGLTLSIYMLLFAFAPLIWAPLSEIYGRTWVLHLANIGCLAFNFGCAFSPTIEVLIVMRLFTGFFAAASIAIGPASISDLFAPQDRAGAMGLFSIGPLLGPTIGAVIGGYVGMTLEIKWIFILMALISAGAAIVGIPLLKETYAPVLRQRQARVNGNLEQFFEEHPELAAGRTFKDTVSMIWVNLSRPTILLFQNFTLFMLAMYLAMLYGLLYLLYSTLYAVFGENGYGFNIGEVGLASLGFGIGTFVGTITVSKWGAQVYNKLGVRDGKSKPEHRLPGLIVGSFFSPIGLLWYGWSAQARVHWVMPIIGTGIFAFGLMLVWIPIQLYIVDTFVFAASATSTLMVFRSLVAFCFPLFAKQMFDKLGLGPGNSLLAGVAVVVGIPFPIWLYFNGERLRRHNKHTR